MKKITLLTLLFCFLLPLTGCGGSDLNDPDVKAVRESYWNQTATIGNLFDQFYDSPKWSKETSPKGEVLVVFEGKISSASDRKEKIIEKLDEFLKRNDYGTGNISVDRMDLYGFLYLLVWDTNNAPQINKIRELDQEIKDKHTAVVNAIRKDQENALAMLKREYKAKFDSVPDRKGDIKNIEQQIDSLYKKQNSFYYPNQGNTLGAVSVSGQKTPTPEQREEMKQIDIQIAQLKNEIHELQSGRSRAESAIMDEYSAKSNKIEEQYSPENASQIKTEYEPLRAERRAKIRDLAMQIVDQHVPTKGNPIKIVWRKSQNFQDPRKTDYTIFAISGKGKQQPGMVILP